MVSMRRRLFRYLLGAFIILYALMQYHFSYNGGISGRNEQIPIVVGKDETAFLFNQGVCIEEDPVRDSKIITVYNAEANTHKDIFGFDVKFLNQPFPTTKHEYYENHNAYFLKTKGGLFRNMDHCFKDILVTLFQLLKSLGHLKNTTNVLFTTEERGAHPDFNFDWLRILNVDTKLFPTWNFKTVPERTCFARASFANSTHGSFSQVHHRPRDVKAVTRYILYAYNITNNDCRKETASQPTITIIQRRSHSKRRILNLPEITTRLQKEGYINVTAISFELLKLREQVLRSLLLSYKK